MTTWPAAVSIEDIARAYHCPFRLAARIHFADNQAYRNIWKLGPLRVYWKRGHGWHLDGVPVSVTSLEKLHMSWA